MIEVSFDFSQFERAVADIAGGIEQLPFALSQSLNEAAFSTRRHLVEHTWPDHVTVRNTRFLNAALRIEKATKNSLVVAITDAGAPGRARLKQHDEGGTKLPKGSNLAIPTRSRQALGGQGKRITPRSIPNTFRKGDAVYQRTGKGGHDGLRLLFVLKPAAKQPADVPFSQDFREQMVAAIREGFPKAMAKALATRRR